MSGPPSRASTAHDAILIVCGGLLQVPAVEIAHGLGLKVVMTDANPHAAAMVLADEPVALDIYDAEGHCRLVDDLGRRYHLRGVFAEGADVEVTVASAAAHAGLPGIPVDAARNTKNKVRTRQALDRAAIPNPPWAEVSTLDGAMRAAGRIGFPLMAKAVDNSASRGTSRVDDISGLETAIESARAASTTRTALLEGCFIGDEQSVETLWDEHGRVHRLNIVDRPFDRSHGYAIELGHVNPTGLGPVEQEALFTLTERAAAATGVRFGAFKADTIWTADGPRIIEVTARLSGGFDCQYTTPLASGRSFIRAAMCLSVGRPIDPADLTHRWRRHAAAWVAFPPPGRIVGIGSVDEVKKLPGVAEVILRVGPGDVIQPYHDCGVRPAFVIAVGDTREQAIARAQSGAHALQIETVPA
jgi:biotin carboxylase